MRVQRLSWSRSILAGRAYESRLVIHSGSGHRLRTDKKPAGAGSAVRQLPCGRSRSRYESRYYRGRPPCSALRSPPTSAASPSTGEAGQRPTKTMRRSLVGWPGGVVGCVSDALLESRAAETNPRQPVAGTGHLRLLQLPSTIDQRNVSLAARTTTTLPFRSGTASASSSS